MTPRVEMLISEMKTLLGELRPLVADVRSFAECLAILRYAAHRLEGIMANLEDRDVSEPDDYQAFSGYIHAILSELNQLQFHTVKGRIVDIPGDIRESLASEMGLSEQDTVRIKRCLAPEVISGSDRNARGLLISLSFLLRSAVAEELLRLAPDERTCESALGFLASTLLQKNPKMLLALPKDLAERIISIKTFCPEIPTRFFEKFGATRESATIIDLGAALSNALHTTCRQIIKTWREKAFSAFEATGELRVLRKFYVDVDRPPLPVDDYVHHNNSLTFESVWQDLTEASVVQVEKEFSGGYVVFRSPFSNRSFFLGLGEYIFFCCVPSPRHPIEFRKDTLAFLRRHEFEWRRSAGVNQILEIEGAICRLSDEIERDQQLFDRIEKIVNASGVGSLAIRKGAILFLVLELTTELDLNPSEHAVLVTILTELFDQTLIVSARSFIKALFPELDKGDSN